MTGSSWTNGPLASVLMAILLLLNAAMRTARATAAIEQQEQIRSSNDEKITDIQTKALLDEGGVLQLQVNWTDTIKDASSYKIFVNALDDCPEPTSCYVTNIESKSVIIPEHPTNYVEGMECVFKLDCNYTLTVETANTLVSKSIHLNIPYCVGELCSCRNATNLPNVSTTVLITAADEVNINWTLPMKNDSDLLKILQPLRLDLKISELANPGLLWGGRHTLVTEEVYEFNDLQYQLMGNDTVQGTIQLELALPLSSNGTLELQSFVMDDLNCQGPMKTTRSNVPNFNETIVEEAFLPTHQIVLLILTGIFLMAAVMAYIMHVCRRQLKTTNVHLEPTKEEQYLSPFTTIELEDNYNYVDRDIQEAQVKGLADVFEVPFHAVRFGPEIGEGAFGRVFKGYAMNLRRMRGTTMVAIKQLKANPSTDEVAEFLGEIEMLKGVGTHHNIVCFLGCCTIRAPYLLIMEFVGRGDLLTYLRTVRYETDAFKFQRNTVATSTASTGIIMSSRPTPTPTTVQYIELKMSSQSIGTDSTNTSDYLPNKRQAKPSLAETTYTVIEDEEFATEPFRYILDHKELHNFALQIANGMRFLEEQEITHRDLAARNVLIDDHKTLKISDFGLSRHGIYTNTKTRKLPLRWLSIEAICDNIYSSKSDLWAYGVVLWEIGTLGATPYPNISNQELIPLLLSGHRLEKPEICTDQVYELMKKCWAMDPSERPSFDQLYKLLSPRNAYVDLRSLSDDYVFPPIKDNE